MKILGIDPTVEAKEVAEAVRSCLKEEKKKPFRGTRNCWGCGEERGMLRVPALGSRNATSVPQERIRPGMTTSRGLCVVRIFGRQPPIGSLRVQSHVSVFMRRKAENNEGERDTQIHHSLSVS